MTVKKMNDFINAVLTLHPSRSHSSQQLFPRVALTRLSHETIKKHTGMHDRFESSNDKSRRSSSVSPSRKELSTSNKSSFLYESENKDKKLPETPSESEKSSDILYSDCSIKSVFSKTSSIMRKGNLGEQREDEDVIKEMPDQDTSSSYSSDELPDLNDPSWGKAVKRKEVKMQKKKDKNAQRTDAKLMKNARKIFQHQAIRYKASKEFMKNIKANKDVKNTELVSHYTDSLYSQNVQSKVSDHRMPNMASQSLSLSNWSNPSLFKPAALQTIEKTKNIDSIKEDSAKSAAELMSLKLKESMARYVGQEKPSSVPEDVTHLKVQELNTYAKDKVQFEEKEISQDEKSDDSNDTDDSSCTVLFDDNEINQIYPLESAHAMTSDRDFATLADESSNNKKRKDSPLGREESIETNKKLRQADKQETVKEKDANQQPMVMIPISISNPISLSPAVAKDSASSCIVSPVSHLHTTLKSHSGSVNSSNVSSQANDTAQLGKNVITQISVKEKEASDLHCNISSVISVEVGKSTASMVDPQKNLSYPSNAPQNELILVDTSTSQGSSGSSNENFHAASQVSSAVSEEQMTNNCKPATTIPIHKETDKQEKITKNLQEMVTGSSNNSLLMTKVNKAVESQQKKTSSSPKKVAVGSNEKPFKSLKQISLHFQELTTKRVQCEEKIKQVKEEYNKKLEALEEEKKNFDIEINKMIVTMSEWKELSEEDQVLSNEQQGCPITSVSANVREAGPEVTATAPANIAVAQLPQHTPVTMATTSNSESRNAERISINIIPAASIRNFGRKKIPSTKKQATIPTPPQPKLSLIQTTMSSSQGQEKRTLRTVTQVPVMSLSSPSGSGDFSSANNIQVRSDMLQYSAFDKQSPPNAVVIPGQQHPVVTSSHTLCRPPPLPTTTHTAQRRAPLCQMVKPVQSSNQGSLHASYKNPVSSQGQQIQNFSLQVQQKCQYIPLQLQQHQQQQYHHHQQQNQQQQQQQQQPQLMRLLQEQQLPQQQKQQQKQQQHLHQQQQHHHQHQQAQLQPSSNTHLAQQQPNNSQSYMQQYQPVQGQLQNNATPLQGVPPGTYSAPVATNSANCSSAQMVPNFTLGAVIANERNTAGPTSRIIVSHSQSGNSSTPNTNSSIKKAGYIVSAPSIVSSLNPNARFQHNHSHTTTAAVNTNDISIPVSANIQAPSANRGVNQPTTGPLPASTPQTSGGFSQESGINEPVCRMCGSAGIFTCCNNVIYCSTACQGSDWSTHQHHCTNTSTPDAS